MDFGVRSLFEIPLRSQHPCETSTRVGCAPGGQYKVVLSSSLLTSSFSRITQLLPVTLLTKITLLLVLIFRFLLSFLP